MFYTKQHSLVEIIGRDLFYYSKIPLFLLTTILLSGVLIVNITHKTRSLIIKREQIIMEKDMLEVEWRNLILEERVLCEQSRIEHIATKKLNMKYVDPLKISIITQTLSN